MQPNEYQTLAMRTKCDQGKATLKLVHLQATQINHAIIGLAGEVGELASLWQKLVYYGKDIPLEELKAEMLKEFGDVLWYVAEGLDALGLNMEDVMKANIAKLRARYPEKYTADQALATRDETAEEAAVAKALTENTAELKEWIATMKPSPDRHPSHVWREPEKAHTRCVKCGAYGHLSSGMMKCLAAAPDDGTLILRGKHVVQDGHGFGHIEEDELETRAICLGRAEGHDWEHLQTLVGSGMKCKRCGETKPE